MTHAQEVGSQEGVPVDGVGSLTWRKSTRSIGNGQCVEAARTSNGCLAMRDSTDKSGPVILISQREWSNFLRKIKVGDL
jgi:hypothetical protein